MTSTPEPEAAPVAVPDPVLIESHGLALAALHEITPAATVGDAAGYRLEDDGVVSLRFANRLDGYPGWFWTVSLAHVEGAEPTVLEVELLPGEDALLAPEWVPWAVRLAEYHATQAALAESADAEAGADDDDDDHDDDDEAVFDLDDVDDLDAADFDEDGSRILHAGDVDGVDIDELADDTDLDDDDLVDDDPVDDEPADDELD
jgi:hypothetical protein